MMERMKLWGKDRYVWEVGDGVFLNDEKTKAFLTDIPDDFGDVPDEDILELEIDENSSEEYRIIGVFSKKELQEILEVMNDD